MSYLVDSTWNTHESCVAFFFLFFVRFWCHFRYFLLHFAAVPCISWVHRVTRDTNLYSSNSCHYFVWGWPATYEHASGRGWVLAEVLLMKFIGYWDWVRHSEVTCTLSTRVHQSMNQTNLTIIKDLLVKKIKNAFSHDCYKCSSRCYPQGLYKGCCWSVSAGNRQTNKGESRSILASPLQRPVTRT